MKIVAFSDIHERISDMRKAEKLIKQQKPDIAVSTGDFTVFEQHIEEMIKWMSGLGIPVFLVHGNHEQESIVRKLCTFYKNVSFVHKKILKFREFTILGYGGGGFSFTGPKFEKWAKKLPKIKNGIFITHQPAFNTKLDVVAGRHVGSKSFRKFIENHQEILLHVCGHIHETFGKTDKIRKVKTINPVPSGTILTV